MRIIVPAILTGDVRRRTRALPDCDVAPCTRLHIRRRAVPPIEVSTEKRAAQLALRERGRPVVSTYGKIIITRAVLAGAIPIHENSEVAQRVEAPIINLLTNAKPVRILAVQVGIARA